jgi:ABC-2 type transport system permease protein
MSTPANALSDSAALAPVNVSPMRPFYWSVRRELWEHRSLYLAPLAVAALILVASLIGTIHLPAQLHDASLGAPQQHELIERPYHWASLLLMLTTFFVGVFYCLDALQGERRDRSILFWKSLPVSDLTTVLAKASIPLVVIPLVTFVITVVTQALMLLLGSARLLGSDAGTAELWSHVMLLPMSVMLLYHLVVVHAFWFAPIWGWLLLCSAWSRRAPYLWATLPLLAVALAEKIAFNTAHFGHWLGHRLMGGPDGMAPGMEPMTMALTPPPVQFLSSPGFWFGLSLTAIFLAAAVRLRRYQGPI